MATNKRMVPKLGSIDELLRLSDQSYKDAETPSSLEGGVRSIPITKIRFFKDHPFRLYEGERLADMADSIQNNGVLIPVIVRKIEWDESGYEYEMLAGHNRMNAALVIGLTQLPSIIKEQLSDEEALMYVVETNVLQRSFSDMYPSEKAKVLSLRYSEMFSQGKRNDIIEELKKLENPQLDNENLTSTLIGHRLKSRDIVASEYGLSKNTVARLLRIDKLMPSLKKRLDDADLGLYPAVSLSYLPATEQSIIEELLSTHDYKLDMKKAEALRVYSGKLTIEQATKVLSGESTHKPRSKSPAPFKLKHKVYAKYFNPQSKAAEVEEIIDKALEMYFAMQRQQQPQSHEELEEVEHVPDL